MNILVSLLLCSTVVALVLTADRIICVRDKKKAGCVVIPVRENSCDLERMVRSIYWDENFFGSDFSRSIILVQMEDCKQNDIAQRLADELENVQFVTIEKLAENVKNI